MRGFCFFLLFLLCVPVVFADDLVTVHVGFTDCKSWVAKVFNVPHAFVLLNGSVYEILREDGLIKIKVSDFEGWLEGRSKVRFVWSFKISRNVFDLKLAYLKFVSEGSEFNLFWNNCYHFVYNIWVEREK